MGSIKANLKNTLIPYANLKGEDLTGAKNLEQRQIDQAKGDNRTTILPDYLQYPEHWQ